MNMNINYYLDKDISTWSSDCNIETEETIEENGVMLIKSTYEDGSVCYKNSEGKYHRILKPAISNPDNGKNLGGYDLYVDNGILKAWSKLEYFAKGE